ncbi:MAG: lysylphosphatidylglycerol synthase transmembrane domain-containing protein [Pseudomonadota bacterium]
MLQLIIGIAVAAIFVALIARRVEGGDLLLAIGQANFSLILLAVCIFLTGYACRIARWRSMLLQDNPALRWRDCSGPFMASIAANNVLPFRAGDALRAFAFSKSLKVPKSALLASLLVERLLDLLSLLLALGICLYLFDLDETVSGNLVNLGAFGIIGLGLVVMLLLLFPRIFQPPTQLAIRLAAKVAPGLAERLLDFTDRLFATLRQLAHGPRMAALIAWSALVWGLEGAVFWVIAFGVPGMIVPVAGWLALPVSTLATLLPSTPGYVGTFDFFAIAAVEAMGNPTIAATAYALIVHLVLWLPPTLIGGAFFLFWIAKRKRNSQIESTESS